MKKAIRVAWLCVAILLTGAPLFAQTANGRISGTVKDATGGAIVGAAVTVTDVARGLTRNLTSDEAGAYLAPNLLPGTYTVHATFTGFQAWQRTNILLEVGADLAVDAVLQPGAQTQTITVTEELPLVNTTSSTLGGTLANATIEELPINGRNFQNLQELRPGVILNLANDSNGAGAASVNGIRPESSNEYLVEGLHVMDPFTGQSVINNIGVNGDAATILPIDAIQEFNAQFNPKAEYGFKAGGSVGVGLKSGTNAYHGTGIAFFRDDAMDARGFFNTATQPKVNGTLKQWGGTFGGPIKKDKLFFFLAFEKQNYVQGNPTGITAPFTDPGMLNCSGSGASYACSPIAGSVGGLTPDATNHLILACLAVKNNGGGLSPQSLLIAGLNSDCSPGAKYPNPNFFVPHGATDHGAGLASNPSISTYFPNAQTDTMALGSLAKIDYQLNAQHSVNGFFYKGVGNDTDCQSCVRPEWRAVFGYYALVGAGSWTWLPNSVTANSFRVGYANLNQPADSVLNNTGVTAAQLGIPTGIVPSETVINAGMPSMAINNFYTLASRTTERQGPMTSLEFNDQVSYLRGKHALKFGAARIAEHTNGGIWTSGQGSFTFGNDATNGLASFLSGQNPVPAAGPIVGIATSGLQSATALFGDPRNHVDRTSYSLFVQDDFRVRPRLTLNLGVRYEYTTVPKERNHQLGGFNAQLGLTQEGIQTEKIFNTDGNNFSPRVGFAWDVQGNGKTVIRAGGSIIFELVTLRTFLDISPSLAASPTAWIIGCTSALSPAAGANNIPAGASSNCPGTLFTPGGTNNVGTVSFTASAGTLGAIHWDAPAGGTILPVSGVHNCNPNIFTADVPGAAQPGRPGTPCTINFADPNLKAPYVEGWNLSIQRALRNNISLEVAYVGNHGAKLIGKTDLNQAASNIPGVGWNAVVPSGASAGLTLAQVCGNVAATAGTALSTIQNNCQSSKLNNSTKFTNGLTASTLYSSTVQASRAFITQFPYLQNIQRIWNRDTSNYNGLQVSLTVRNYHGLSATAGYTWAHALDIGSDNTSNTGSDAYNNNLDYGRAASDVRHRFTFAPTYGIPGRQGYWGLLTGWRVNANFKYQTGRPWTPTDSRDFYGTTKNARWNFFGDYQDFAVNLAGQNNAVFHPGGLTPPTPTAAGTNAQVPGTNYTASDLAINTSLCSAHAASVATLTAFGCWVQGGSALTPPALNQFGSVTKGLFVGPVFWNIDSSVTKMQKVTERLSAEFRAEFFNPLNHPNFSQPTTVSVNSCTVGACTFGQTSNTPNVSANNALIGSGGPRRIQFGIKLIF